MTAYKLWLLTSITVCLFATGASAQSLPQHSDAYFAAAQTQLLQRLSQQPNTRQAKNIILFVGDGMSVSTVTAARIHDGQKRGVDGESNNLGIDRLPYLALTKTYSHNGQVSDSAPTASAMMTGVKMSNGVIGMNSSVTEKDCLAGEKNKVTSLGAMAKAAGMSVGIISTARITHATPAAVYAHTAFRDWEDNNAMPAECKAAGIKDISTQLVTWPHGDGLTVALGGGRQHFLPDTASDPEDNDRKGARKDGIDLMRAWTDRYPNSGAVVWNKEQFDKIDPKNTRHLLGLFERGHMEYEADRAKDKGGEPSLAEMTSKSIDMLSQNGKGYFLMVEGGRIDHAHHSGNAARALEDTLAFDAALKIALSKVNIEETLVVLTADHSHTLTIGGYPKRGNPILGLVVDEEGKLAKGRDGKPYTTLSYANGPGAVTEGQPRPDLTNVDTKALDFVQQALVPINSQTHAGDDVVVYAVGPWAHLFHGTVEQNYIFHVMNFASKIGERTGAN